MSMTSIERRVTLCTIPVAFMAWMAVKMPMPALPELQHVFGTGNQAFKVSVTLNLVGFGVSQLFVGQLSEKYGRRPVLIYSFLLAMVGTLLALFAMNYGMYLAGRIIEGFAVGASGVLGRAIMVDSMEKTRMAKTYSYYAIAALLPPAIGPVIGGYLLEGLGWRYIFAGLFLLLGATVVLLYFYLPETKQNKKTHIDFRDVGKQLWGIGKSLSFWVYVLIYALINGYMISFYAAMPFWYIVHFRMQENQYGWIAFIPIATYIMGSTLANMLLSRTSMERVLVIGLIISLVVGPIAFVLDIFANPTIISITALVSLFSVASGMVTPMTNATMMHRFKDHVTVAGALISGIRMAGAGLLVLVASNIDLTHFTGFAIYTTAITIIALVIYLFIGKIILGHYNSKGQEQAAI